MEKLTIEQKAQRYDEAISMAKKFYTPDSNNINLKATLEIIFSELKEDEDEKIRKWLIALIKSNEYGSISNIGEMPCPKLNVLAWLEKQSKTFTKKDVDDAYLKGINNTKNEIEKQYKATYQIRKDIATFIFNYKGDIKDRAKWIDYLGIKVFFVEKQSEQETLCDKCKKEQPSHSCQDITELGRCALEKQGEQKPVDEIAKEVCKNKESATTFLKSAGIMNEKGELAEQYRQSEQNTTNKVEPKFKVGQTIKKEGFNLGFTIVKIEDGFYYNDVNDNFPFTDQDNWELVEKNPTWSEEDEKEVTVLEAYIRSKDWSERHIDRALGIVDELVNKVKSLRLQKQCVITEEELSIAKKDAYNEALDKIEYSSGEPTFDDGRRDAIWKGDAQPQNTWKPSDEQMDAVKSAALDVVKFSSRSEQLRLENEPYYKALVSLYNDLEKLREGQL